MADLLLNLSRSTIARSVVKKAKLPISLPPVLVRDAGAWQHQTLAGRTVALGGESQITGDLKRVLSDAGANLVSSEEECSGVVFDATGFKNVADLYQIQTFFHSCLPKLRNASRILIVAKVPLSTGHPAEAALQEAMTGFTRSLAKEVGKKGYSVNMIEINDNATLDGAVRFFLSHHSAFVTGQVIVVGGSRVVAERFESLIEERTILVTGAAQGIGAAIARRLAKEGAKVILLDRPQEMESLEALAKEINGVVLPVDLGKDESTAAVIKKLWEYAPIHGVVHNAGVTRDKTLARMTAERWEQVLNINLHIPVSMTDMILSKENDSLLAKDASFIFMSSISGIAGNAGQTNYAASKAGLIGYVRAAAAAHFDKGYRFNCVAPGFIETRMTAAIPFAVREVARRLNTLNQGGDPDDVAEAVTWVISPAGNGINGQTLRVCGQNMIGA